MDNEIKRKSRKDRFNASGRTETAASNEPLAATEPMGDGLVEQLRDNRIDVAEELEELFLRETITKDEYKKLKESNGLVDTKSVNKIPQNETLSTSAEHHSSSIPFPYNSNGIPVNWTQTKSCDPQSTNGIYHLVPLGPGDEEYAVIHDEMQNSGIEVTKIERLENIYLLNRFKSETEDIKRPNRPKGFSTNITYLYHGTKVDKTRICEEGLDQRLSRMGFFGKGIYFSDNPLKCIHYARDHTVEESYILKCRVILGHSKVFTPGEYDTSLQREPEKPGTETGWRFYDSVMGCPKDYNEFVVYENRRAMIEYIITFKLSQIGATAVEARAPSPVQPYGLSSHSGLGIPGGYGNSHSDKLEEIRETIRRKRCIEKGEEYTPPDEDKLKRDRETWMRLQNLHKGLHTSGSSVQNLHKSPSTSESLISQTGSTNKPSVLSSPSTSEATEALDPVDEVMDSLVTDFLAVTNTDNIETAKYYIERSEMQVDKAITLYFEEML